MMSPVSQTRRWSAVLAAALLIAAVGGVGANRAAAQDAPGAAVPPGIGPNPFADRFPDVVLKTHEGKNVRFYDDLLAGKIVLINFMYASCKGR
jgi:protein SCO1/2